MELHIERPADTTPASVINAVQLATKKIQTLRREEEHIIVTKQQTDDLLFSSLITAVVEQKRREGYLLTMKNANQLSSISIIATQKRSEMDEVIDRLTLVFLSKHNAIKNPIFYILGELIDNVFEHARSTFIVMACKGNDQTFSLTVVDVGISIPGAYRANAIKIENDCQALLQSVSGVSTKTVEERGTGLPSVKRLATAAFSGQCNILSAGAILQATPKSVSCQNLDFFWQGTAVHITGALPTKPIDLYAFLG